MAEHSKYWFQYFPESFMWSQGMMIAIEMARWGGSAMSEVDRVGQRLKGKIGDNEAWGVEWEREAQRIEKMGDDAAGENHPFTAASHYLRAATYYFVGERFVRPGPKKVELYQSCLRCFRRGTKVRYPNIERVDVKYEGTTLPAWFMKSPVAGKAPTVCFFDGLDSAKELSILFGGVELANRGIHTLAIDGPGQGEALRLQGIPSRFDYEVPARAAYEYLAQRPEVDAKRMAVMGFSMGGYYAPRAAAMEPRFAACVAWGGHWDYHESWVRRRRIMESGGTKLSAPSFQLPWVLGMPDMDACMKKLENYRLAGVAEKMRCPFYCIHGENDNIVPLEFAQKLYDACGSEDKTLKVLTTLDGGSDHCQEDNRQVGSNLVADWLAQRLGGRL